MRTIFASLAIVWSTFAVAQTNEAAKALLNEVKANIQSFTDQKLDFTSTIEIPTGDANNPKTTRTSSGSVVVVGENYKVDLNGQTIILNGNKAYVIAPDDREVTVRILGDEDMAFTPNGIVAKFESGSSLAMAGKETIDGKTIQYVKIRPNGNEEIRDIVLGIDMATKRIYSFTEYSTSDVVTKYVVSNYEVNTGVDPSTVEFKRADYEGWRINEPRTRRRR